MSDDSPPSVPDSSAPAPSPASETTSDKSSSPDSSSSSSSAPGSSEDSSAGSDSCAEIPAAPHAVLAAEITLLLHIPYPPDEATQLSHKVTLTNADGSYSVTLAFASDCEAGEDDDSSKVTFADLKEDDTYSLQCNDGTTTYSIFEGIAYADISEDLPTAPRKYTLDWDAGEGTDYRAQNVSFDDLFQRVKDLSGSGPSADSSPPSDAGAGDATPPDSTAMA